MGSSRTSRVTIRTRRRPWWEWWLIAWARWLHGLFGALVTRMER